MKRSLVVLTVLQLGAAGACFGQTDPANALVGTWEYRQAAGRSVDPEGELLIFRIESGALKGVYFGLERMGEHGLYFTAVDMKDLTADAKGAVSFAVPERGMFRTRPESVPPQQEMTPGSAGVTRYVMRMQGRVEGDRLTLECSAIASSCPDAVLVFHKGGWKGK